MRSVRQREMEEQETVEEHQICNRTKLELNFGEFSIAQPTENSLRAYVKSEQRKVNHLYLVTAN